jgi:hypothetical protein
MRHLRKQTNTPIPEMTSWDEDIDHELGAPYILMRVAPGKSAYRIWFDEEDQDGKNADNPSQEITKKRETFLKSLARHMVEL